MRYRILLWDIDGTLLDFGEAEKAAIRACFQKFNLGECSDDMLREYSGINTGYWQRLERGEMTKEEILTGRFVEFFGNHGIDISVAEEFNREYQYRLGDTVVFQRNALETLESLKDTCVQCAVTNGTKIAQDRKLDSSGMRTLFDHVFISEEMGAEKPGAAFFEQVFRKTGRVNPDEVLIIGDSITSDMQGGFDAGIRTCWYNPAEKLYEGNIRIDYEIKDLKDVIEIVRG